MRILYLSSWFPYPPDNGARMRTYNLLRQLARRHEIALLSFVQGEAPTGAALEAVGALCQVLGTLPQRHFQPSKPRALLRLLSSQPRSALEMYDPRMRECLDQALRQHDFDLVIGSEIGPGVAVAPYLAKLDHIPCVIEDLEVSMIWNQYRGQTTWRGKFQHSLTWWKQKRYTVRLLSRMQGCTVASETEQALLHRLLPDTLPLAVVPNGVDLASYRTGWRPAAPDTLVFPGALTYQANFDAMVFFLREVWPLIRAARPGVTLRITGRTDDVPLARLALTEGVILTGYLDDVRPTVAQSRVCVVPLLTGGGTRLKILEAMALGTPVVSTTQGAEGLAVVPGKDVLIADEPAAFAGAVLRLLADEALCAQLAANGRELVEARYSWEACAAQLERLLDQVVEQGYATGA